MTKMTTIPENYNNIHSGNRRTAQNRPLRCCPECQLDHDCHSGTIFSEIAEVIDFGLLESFLPEHRPGEDMIDLSRIALVMCLVCT